MIWVRFDRFHTSFSVVWNGVVVWKDRLHTHHHTPVPPFRGVTGVEVWKPDQVVVAVVWKLAVVFRRLSLPATEPFSAWPLWVSSIERECPATGPAEACAMAQLAGQQAEPKRVLG